MRGWPAYRGSVASIPTDFLGAGGVGIILGGASNGLVDVDCDCPEAVALAPLLLPDTLMISGRALRPRSHYWYKVEGPVPTKRYHDPVRSGDVLIELRGEGAQTAVAPTLHPDDGDLYGWDCEGAPTLVHDADLRRAVASAAAACLLVRAWTEGTRHELALALAGLLVTAAWPHDEIWNYLHAIATAASDPEIDDRQRAVTTTLERHAAGECVTGVGRLAELLAPRVVATIVNWLALPFEVSDVDDSAGGSGSTLPYLVVNGAICRMRRGVPEPLCDFTASIVEEIAYDDGSAVERIYVITGTRADGVALSAVRVSAAEFDKMGWVAVAWGASAIVVAGPGQRDKLREAILRLSTPTRRTVYRQTGWREVDGQLVYLHGGGAVGGDNISVELDPPLDRYVLPSQVLDIRDAVRCSARLYDCGPATTMVPVVAVVHAAPLASLVDVDFSVWLEGLSGSGKSVIGAFGAGHFGPMTRTSLPENWSSTETAIEHTLFTLADALAVVDDYAPQGSAFMQQQQEAVAARIIRAIGNRTSRGRMTRDLTRRPGRPPRGLVLCTGEMLPPGTSIQARLVVVEVDRKALDWTVITEIQSRAERLPHAMAGYIEWLRPQLDRLRRELPARRGELRAQFQSRAGHMRAAESLALLMIGIELHTRFALEVGAIDVETSRRWITTGMDALRSIGQREAEHAHEANPAETFMATLRSALSTGQAAIFPRERQEAMDVLETGPRIGWRDDANVYLAPVAARQVVAEIHRRSGDSWPYPARAVDNALLRGGYVTRGPDGRPTRQMRIWGRVQRVLVIERRHFDGEPSEGRA